MILLKIKNYFCHLPVLHQNCVESLGTGAVQLLFILLRHENILCYTTLSGSPACVPISDKFVS